MRKKRNEIYKLLKVYGAENKASWWNIADAIVEREKKSRKEVVEEVREVKLERFDMAILESEDFERGFRQGFEVCWNKCLDRFNSLTKPK